MNIMAGSSLIRFAFIFIPLFPLAAGGFSQESERLSFRMIFYNTENFFDVKNDSLTNDDEFLPDGTMRWNSSRFRQKINSLYKVLTAAGDWDPPSLAGLCEIENRDVLENLVYDTYLSKYNYGIIHGESKDPRGIDVGIIYRKDIYTLLTARQMIPAGYNPSEFRTRSVLYAKLMVAGDTIHIFLNHWPSRRGGVLAGENDRKRISGMIGEKADSICRSVSGTAKIIIAGDFNCSPDDAVLLSLAGKGKTGTACGFTNLARGWSEQGKGTYRYQGIWEMLDQIIISDKLLDSSGRIHTGMELFSVFSPDFLLVEDPVFPGSMPLATYRGYRYQGGFSDHLPVIINFIIRNQDQ